MERSHQSYPDFSALYGEVNGLFYEWVISQFPLELWVYILELLYRKERSIKYSHAWVQWTLVSKTFYQAVYRMSQIFMNVQLFPDVNLVPVLSRFSSLKHLTIPCFSGELQLPPLEKLEKLKIRYAKWSRCCCEKSEICGQLHDFSFLREDFLPSLKCLSFRFSCLRKTKILMIPLKIRERITKVSLNGFGFEEDDLEELFPSVTFLKSKSSRFYMSESYSRQLQEIHCVYTQNLVKFTGRCRGFDDCFYKPIMKDYIEGKVEEGKRVGDWVSYEF